MQEIYTWFNTNTIATKKNQKPYKTPLFNQIGVGNPDHTQKML